MTNTITTFDTGEVRATDLVVHPIDDGRDIEKHQNGLGVGDQDAPAYTLDTRQHSAVAMYETPTINAASTVRRLTPTECERLQGFPDGHTAERFDFKKNMVVTQADSNRYKQMGNAIAVPVFEWVIGRLVAVANDEVAA